MSTTGNVEITVADGAAGTIAVPSNTVQVVMGCCSSGTANAIVATRDPRTLASTFGYGPLPEAAAMVLAAGGTVLAMRLTTNTAGAILAGSALTVTGATNASPIVITTSTAHGLVDGAIVTVAAVGGNTNANGTYRILALSSNTFSLVGTTGNSAYTSGGTATWGGAIQSGSGTSLVTFSGAAYDDFLILLTVVTGGTVGTAGIQFTISLDGGRSTGPLISLGTATSYVIPGTNVTAAFAAGTLVAADTSRCVTKAPVFNTAGVQAAINALKVSPYATSGWGSMHLVTPRAGISAADVATIGDYIDGLFTTNKIPTALITGARDANLPSAWGGDGESEATWMAAVLLDYSAASELRMGVAAGHYNMASPFPNTAAGVPRFRRGLAWAWACRIVSIQVQQHEGYVRLGGLGQIILDPVNDPLDGFVYHDEAVNPGFDGLKPGGTGRLTAGMKRIKKTGIFISNPLTLAPVGSVFQLMPRRRVMDLGCGIIQDVGSDRINGDLRLTPANTLDPRDAVNLQDAFEHAFADQMLAEGMLSDGPNGRGATVAIDLSNNVFTTGKVKGTATLYGKGYVLELDISIAFNGTEV